MWDRGTVLGGRYTLAERIGGGAMGDVWRADDTVLERRVAVKILRPELLDDARFAKRFRREALILASLDHPGIVDVHDYGENALGDGSRVAYIVMELVEGRPLDEFLKESGPLPPEQALATTAEALEALHAAHRRQVVHRDIKPSNLLICADGRVKVTDFGLARDLATSKITPEHAVVGTALYIAPEQVEGHGTTPASDLYSMGVVCYKMLTGKLPFDGERAIEILVKHVQQPVPALPADFPQPVRDFVATALAKKPEDRFPDAATMAAAARTAAPAAASSAVAGGAVVSPESGGAAEVMVAPSRDARGVGAAASSSLCSSPASSRWSSEVSCSSTPRFSNPTRAHAATRPPRPLPSPRPLPRPVPIAPARRPRPPAYPVPRRQPPPRRTAALNRWASRPRPRPPRRRQEAPPSCVRARPRPWSRARTRSRA